MKLINKQTRQTIELVPAIHKVWSSRNCKYEFAYATSEWVLPGGQHRTTQQLLTANLNDLEWRAKS